MQNHFRHPQQVLITARLDRGARSGVSSVMTYQRRERSLRPPNQPNREVELKLAIPIGSADALEAHLRAADAETAPRRHEVTTYFDTPDRVLERGGVGLRVRFVDGSRIQTLKADRQDSVAADRAEWEWPLKQDKPDLRLAEKVLDERGLPRELDLEPVFRTEIDRTTRIVNLDSGTVIETAYDEGLIIAGDLHLPIRELELELRGGQAAPLYRLACELHAVAPLILETESKGARGYLLASGGKPETHKSRDTSIEPRTSAAEAFRQIVNAGLGHLLANQAAGLASDAEGVHQMRIAIRRLRAALTLFQPFLEPHAATLFQDELRRIGRVFGEARDWDVFCLQILPDVLKSERDAGWRDLLRKPATAARTAAHAEFTREIRSSAFTRLVLGLAAWAEEMRLPSNLEPWRPVEDLCPALLDRLAAKVARRGRQIRHRSETELHALRKSLKKLRYGIDFLRPVFHPAPLKPYLHDCKKLQQTLGDINDTVTATALAERLVKGARLDLAPAVGVLAEQLGCRRNDALKHLAKRWHAFSGQSRFWA
jgi:triphosphatase